MGVAVLAVVAVVAVIAVQGVVTVVLGCGCHRGSSCWVATAAEVAGPATGYCSCSCSSGMVASVAGDAVVIVVVRAVPVSSCRCGW